MLYLILKLIVSAVYAFAIGIIFLNSIELAVGQIRPIYRVLFIILLFTLFMLL